MFSSATGMEYQPLRQSPDSPPPIPKECDSEQLKETGRLKQGSRMSYVSLFLCVVFTLVNILVTVVAQRASPNVGASLSAPVTSKNIHLLRRPSQYIRFDEVHRPSPPIARQFKNYPITLAQVDAANPQRILYTDKAYMSPIGTVVPEDRRVLITPTISTIIQFRTIDWGMEDCQLHISVPALGGDTKSGNISLVLYRLNQTRTYPLDTVELSFQSRPPRVAKIENIQLSRVEGTSWSRRFACKSDDVLSFELGCSGISEEGDCFLEWWQKQGSEPAVYLTQHATV
ncbi:hypothetical protein C8R44DRAFT_676496 [Mycena epipterygia]|nr:hypothetical protein C8R44DRAFT_676496 [Mycena epipterygia]